MKQLIDPHLDPKIFASKDSEISAEESENAAKPEGSENFWYKWGKNLAEKALDSLENEMEAVDSSAYELPSLGEQLLKDLALFPMWGNLITKKFGNFRVPATSAASESHFKHYKHHIHQITQLPATPQKIVRKDLEYLEGKMKLINIKLAEIEAQKSDENLSTNNKGIYKQINYF